MSVRQKVSQRSVFTAKCPYGDMSLRRSVLTVKCPYGEVSLRRIVLTAMCPYGEVSLRRSVLTAKCPHGEVSSRWSVLTAKCPCGEVCLRRTVLWRSVERRKVLRPKVQEPSRPSTHTSPSSNLYCEEVGNAGQIWLTQQVQCAEVSAVAFFCYVKIPKIKFVVPYFQERLSKRQLFYKQPLVWQWLQRIRGRRLCIYYATAFR